MTPPQPLTVAAFASVVYDAAPCVPRGDRVANLATSAAGQGGRVDRPHRDPLPSFPVPRLLAEAAKGVGVGLAMHLIEGNLGYAAAGLVGLVRRAFE